MQVDVCWIFWDIDPIRKCRTSQGLGIEVCVIEVQFEYLSLQTDCENGFDESSTLPGHPTVLE